MKKALIMILALASITRSYAQNPGYLGKHVMLTYDLHTMVRMGFFDNSYERALEFRHEAQVSTILGRFLMANATVQYATNNSYFYEAEAPKPGAPDELITYQSQLKFSNIGIGVGISRYNLLGPGPLAPIGNYVKGHLMLNSFHIVDTAGQYGYWYSQNTLPDFIKQDALGIGLAAGVGFGRTRMIGETIVIDYGLESDWTFLKIMQGANEGETYSKKAYRRLAGDYFNGHTFSIRLGVGGLLF